MSRDGITISLNKTWILGHIFLRDLKAPVNIANNTILIAIHVSNNKTVKNYYKLNVRSETFISLRIAKIITY